MKKLHYSWVVCLGCMLMLLTCIGVAINVFSVAQPFVLEQNGFTNTQTSMLITARSVAYLLGMVITPWFFGLLGYRKGAAVSVLFAVLSYVLYALARSAWVYCLGSVFGGLTYSLGSMVPASVLISRWFRSRRGLPLGLCAAGSGLATVVFSPLVRWVIENHSLSAAFWMLAALCALMGLAVYALLRESPESCGKEPFGLPEEEKQSVASHGENKKEISRLRWGLLFLVGCVVGSVASVGFTHLMILFTTAGFAAADAALSLSISGLSLMVGKCVLGAACDRLGGRRACGIFGLILLLGMMLCTLVGLQSRILMYGAAILYGFGMPLSTVGFSVWAQDFCTKDRFAWGVRLFQLGAGVGGLLFSFMPGAIADLTGSYAGAYGLFLVLCLLSLLVVDNTYRTSACQK